MEELMVTENELEEINPRHIPFCPTTENLAEIASVYGTLCERYPEVGEIGSLEWDQKMVYWGNEFDDLFGSRIDFNSNEGYNHNYDYKTMIISFAMLKILSLASERSETCHRTFYVMVDGERDDSENPVPFTHPYALVYAENIEEAKETYHLVYPDAPLYNVGAWIIQKKHWARMEDESPRLPRAVLCG